MQEQYDNIKELLVEERFTEAIREAKKLFESVSQSHSVDPKFLELIYKLRRINVFFQQANELILRGSEYDYFTFQYLDKVVMFLSQYKTLNHKSYFEKHMELRRKAERPLFLGRFDRYELIRDLVIGVNQEKKFLLTMKGEEIISNRDEITPIKNMTYFKITEEGKEVIVDSYGRVIQPVLKTSEYDSLGLKIVKRSSSFYAQNMNGVIIGISLYHNN